MRNVIRAMFAIAACGALLGVVAAPASAGGPPVLKVAKPNGSFENFVNANVALGQKKTFFLKAKAGTGQKEAGSLEQEESLGAEYKIKYYKGDQNITAEVKADGFEFNLKPTAKRFRVTIKVVSGPQAPDCLYVDLFQIDAGGVDAILIALNNGVCLLPL